jgi:hypothetical protein
MRYLTLVGAPLVLAVACSGQKQPETQGTITPPSDIVTEPPEAKVDTGQTQQFAAQVNGTTATSVVWSVQEVGGGGVDNTGLYTAPLTAGVFHVVATSVIAPTVSGSSVVTVLIPIAVGLSPLTATIDACNNKTFTATVTGSTADTTVVWSVQEGSTGGTVSTTGVYTAPSTAGTYHVVATSHADLTKNAIATVTVNDHVLSVVVSPTPVALFSNGSQQFSANVTTSCGTFTATQTLTSSQLRRLVRR